MINGGVHGGGQINAATHIGLVGGYAAIGDGKIVVMFAKDPAAYNKIVIGIVGVDGVPVSGAAGNGDTFAGGE